MGDSRSFPLKADNLDRTVSRRFVAYLTFVEESHATPGGENGALILFPVAALACVGIFR